MTTAKLPAWRNAPRLPLSKLNQIKLTHGPHSDRSNGLCVIEAVAWVAGEPHSDSPECASRVISRFLRNWNDSLPSDADRARLLRPLVPKLVGTKADAATELKRSWMAFDWLVRELLPAFLDLAKIDTATKLRALKPFTTKIELDAGIPIIQEARAKSAAARAAAGAAAGAAARDAAWDAARAAASAAARAAAEDAAWAAAEDAAWDAARVAAGAAAGAAARDAAWDAARAAAGAAARDAARDAAWDAARAAASAAAGDAARDAAWDAARAAAKKRLAPTVKKLQRSAVKLVERMIACK